MGASGVAQNASLTGDQSARRLCMIRCRWRGTSPSPASGETAIRFDGVASMERIVVPVATPSAKWMQRKSAVGQNRTADLLITNP
jgi:hypothetical protein